MKNKVMIELRGARTQSEVSAKLGITQAAYSLIEAGKRNPSIPMARKIARFYRTSIDILFSASDITGSDKPNEQSSVRDI